MKILNINPYVNTKTISKINHTKPVSFTSLEKSEKTSISTFKKLALQLEAKKLERQAKSIVENSKEVASYAVDRQEFFADKVKQSHDIQENAKAAYISAIAGLNSMDALALTRLDEATGEPITKIAIENPTEKVSKRTLERTNGALKMTDYRHDGTVRKVIFNNDETTISEVGTRGTNKVYYFDNGDNLSIYARNPKLKNGVYTADERFMFKDGNLLGWEEFSTIIYPQDTEKAFQRAEFKDGKLSGLSEDWTRTNNDIIRAKDFYTFEDDIFYSYLKNYQAESMADDGFSASSMLKMTPDKKVSYFAQDIDLSGDAFGYFGKYFEFGKNNNPRYVQVGVDIVENGMKAEKIFEADKDGKMKTCHFNAKIDGLGQIASKSEVEL